MRSKSLTGLLLCLSVVLASLSSQVIADSRNIVRPDTDKKSVYPETYPVGFQRKGIISSVKSGKMIVSGRKYDYTLSLKVHDTGGNASTLDLKSGQAIGFSFDTDKDGTRIIKEIWILPSPKDHRGS